MMPQFDAHNHDRCAPRLHCIVAAYYFSLEFVALHAHAHAPLCVAALITLLVVRASLKVQKMRELWPMLWYCATIECAAFVVQGVLTLVFVCAGCITSCQQNHSGKYNDSDVIVERL